MPEEVLNALEVPAASTDPVEPEQAGEQQDTTGETAPGANQGEPKPEHKGGFQRRIDKLTREKADKERELNYWREQALRSQKPTEEAKPEDTPKADEKPSLDNFQTYEEYIEAVADWKADQRLKKYQADQVAAQEAEKKKAEQQTLQKQWQTKVSTAREAHADFDEAIQSLNFPKENAQSIADCIMSEENGTEVAYYLGTNPAEAERLAGLSPIAAAREIGKLAAKLAKDQPKAEEVARPDPPQTKAPPPPKPVNKTTGTDAGLRDDLDPKEWEKRFRKKMGWEK